MYEVSRYVEANTGGTGVLLDIIANDHTEVGRIVVASSMSVYGEGSYSCEEHGFIAPRLRPELQLKNRLWDPFCPTCNAVLAPVPTGEEKALLPTSVYAISKMDQELLCLAVGAAYGIDVVALRYFNSYGPRQALSNPYTGVAAIFCGRLLNGRPPLAFEDGKQLRDFIHVRDVARATVLAVGSKNAAGEAINVGVGAPLTISQVATVLATNMGVDLDPTITGKFRAGDIRHCWADPSRAEKLLGFRAEIPLEDGVSELDRVGVQAECPRRRRQGLRRTRKARTDNLMSPLEALVGPEWDTLVVFFIITQVVYLVCILVMIYFYTRPVDLVDVEGLPPDRSQYPPVILFYPVLRELESTMRTTFTAIDVIDYPPEKYRIVAIPNENDRETITSLERLQWEFPWLEILRVPATTDSSWNSVWEQWDANDKAYWWHSGKRAGVRDLPPKKTRQLVYAFYTLCPSGGEDTLISYIDADSAPPPNYFLLGAAGATQYDVIQLTNVAGNVLDTWASSFHAFDHMCWDASIYQHMTALGPTRSTCWARTSFRSSDLHAYGGFHPWITIEDPEVGMRLWTNGRRLGVVTQPLVEEVPNTFRHGVTQRKRWVCGFFQSLGQPLSDMGMSAGQRFRARLNLIPCLSLLVNPLGLAVGIWILVLAINGSDRVGLPLTVLAGFNVLSSLIIIGHNWFNVWRVSHLVLDRPVSRLHLAFRLNPIFVMAYWVFWVLAIVIGIQMFMRDKGLVWERTEKIDANHDLVRSLELISENDPASRIYASSSFPPTLYAIADAISADQFGISPPDNLPQPNQLPSLIPINLHEIAEAISADHFGISPSIVPRHLPEPRKIPSSIE